MGRTQAQHYRKLESTARLKRLLALAHGWGRLAPRLGVKVAWLSSGAPVELPLALGVLPQYPENYAALCGARKLGVPLCERAEAAGYSPDLCGYAREHLGSLLGAAPRTSGGGGELPRPTTGAAPRTSGGGGELPRPTTGAPFGGLPRPDLLIVSNNICGTITKWWEHLADRLGAPLFVFDTPFAAGEGQRPAHLLDYATRQVGELIELLERVSGRRLHERRLRGVAERSTEAVRLWNECLELCQARPAPLSSVDRFLAMAPIVALRGTRAAVRFYRALRREVAGRVARGEGAVPGERRRLLWDGIAIWHDLTGLARAFAGAGVSFPVDTYTSAWTGTLSVEDGTLPARAVARVYSEIFLNKPLAERLEIMAGMMRRFELDGFVLHSNRSCKTYSLGQLVVQRELSRMSGRPGLLLESDMVDARHHDAARTLARVAAFLEVLG